MSTLSFFLRATDGTELAYIPAEAWLYMELEIELGEIGRFEGILSTRRFKELPDIFNLSKPNAPLDAVLEVWYRPFTGRNQAYIKPYLLAQYLFRYERREYLQGGRPRETVIMRGPNHLLTRPLVYPPGDLPMVVTDADSLAIAIASYKNGNPPPPVVTSDYYEGASAPANTSTQMTELMAYCKQNTPAPFIPISVPPNNHITQFTLQLDANIAGVYSGNVTFNNNDSDENPFTFNITGRVTTSPEPQIAVFIGNTPILNGIGTVSFGSTLLNNKVERTITVLNTGTADLTLTALSLGGTDFDFAKTLDDLPIRPGASTTFDVRLKGNAAGTFSDTVTFTTNDLTNTPYTFNVSGVVTAVAESQLEVWDDRDLLTNGVSVVNFQTTTVGKPINHVFTVSNNGSSDLTLTNLAVPAGFQIVNGFGSPTVQPNSSTTFTIRLLGAAVGIVSGNVTFDSNDIDQTPFVFNVSGNVSATPMPEIEVIDRGFVLASGVSTLNLGSTTIGKPLTRTFTIINTGGSNLTLNTLAVPAGFSIVSNFGSGNLTPEKPGGIVDHRTAYRYDSTVLAGLQRLSAASWYAWTKGLAPSPVDFSLEPSPTPPYFPWVFKVWPGGRGTDRRANNPFGNTPLVFSAERDNVQQASAIVDRLEELTATVVGGDGNGKDRDVLRVEDPERIDDSPWNYNQRFLHASKNLKFADPGGVEMAYQAGLAFVQEKSPRVQVSLRTRTRRGAIFGRDVFLGDLCTQSVLGTTRDMQVGKVIMKATSDSPLEINIELRTLDGAQFDGTNEYQKILRRIAGVREDAEYLGEAY